MMPVVLTPEAENELMEASMYLKEQRLGLSDEFDREIARLLHLIGEYPRLGARFRNSRYRYVVSRRFSYVIYYEIKKAIVLVVAIPHGRRRQGYWRKRK